MVDKDKTSGQDNPDTIRAQIKLIHRRNKVLAMLLHLPGNIGPCKSTNHCSACKMSEASECRANKCALNNILEWCWCDAIVEGCLSVPNIDTHSGA